MERHCQQLSLPGSHVSVDVLCRSLVIPMLWAYDVPRTGFEPCLHLGFGAEDDRIRRVSDRTESLTHGMITEQDVVNGTSLFSLLVRQERDELAVSPLFKGKVLRYELSTT